MAQPGPVERKVPLTSMGAIIAAERSRLVAPLSTRLVDNVDQLSGRDVITNIDTRISDNFRLGQSVPAPDEGML